MSAPEIGLDPLLRAARARLIEAGGEPAVVAAETRGLLAHVLGSEPTHLLLLTAVPAAEAARFEELIARRATGVPLQHLTGVAHFRRISLVVGPGVFVPRPETEVMTGWAIERLTGLLRRTAGGDTPGATPGDTGSDRGRVPVAVDLCSGSGAVIASLDEEAPGAELYAVELSEDAAEYARRNLAGRPIDLRVENIDGALPELNGRVDLITANPPYIPLEAWESVPAEVRDHDPELALFSGLDGLDAIALVAAAAARLLRPGGVFCCEHAELQKDSAPAVFAATGVFADVHDHRDLTDRPRFVTGRRI